MSVRRPWTASDDELLQTRYPHERTSTVAARLGRSVASTYNRAFQFGLAKSAAYLASPDACRLRRGDQVGAPYRFGKGHVPANKGLRRPGWAPGRMAATQFKAGTPSWRLMPIGATRLIEGYVYRKVSDVPKVPYTVNWKLEHRLVWTRVHGPVPAGQALAFLDGDRLNTRLENLVLISRRDLMRRNSIHNLPAPLPQIVQLLGALKRTIRRSDHAQH